MIDIRDQKKKRLGPSGEFTLIDKVVKLNECDLWYADEAATRIDNNGSQSIMKRGPKHMSNLRMSQRGELAFRYLMGIGYNLLIEDGIDKPDAMLNKNVSAEVKTIDNPTHNLHISEHVRDGFADFYVLVEQLDIWRYEIVGWATEEQRQNATVRYDAETPYRRIWKSELNSDFTLLHEMVDNGNHEDEG